MKQFTEYDAIREYKNTMMDALQHSFPLLSRQELSTAIDYSITKRCKNPDAVIHNNYTKEKIDTTVLGVLDYIMELEPIITSSGVLFKKHKKADNPLARVIMGFIEKRSVLKDKMYKYPKGSEDFAKYNLLQLLEKLNANACYGALGAATCLIYNLYVAEAVTRQGRSYISCSIMLFEMFLANNVKFNSLNEIITFIHNVVNEKDRRKYNDYDILDRDITLEECFFKVCNTIDMTMWMPTEKEMSLIWDYLRGLDREDINRIYYKNNLYMFADLPSVTNVLIRILSSLQSPFLNPNEPPKEARDDLDLLVSLCKEYVYYAYFPIDKLDRIEYMQRDVVAIVDTDSTIISFDAWYRFLLDKTYNIDMPIKHEKFDMIDIINQDEFGDKDLRLMFKEVEPELDYDFYTDEIVEMDKTIEMFKLIPQESFKYSIINIIAYVCSDLVVDYLREYTKLTGSYEEGVKCRMIMKNEFYFLSALIAGRRNYADLQLLQEGNVIPPDNRMAIMGMPINKSVLSDSIKKELQEILYHDILTSEDIDQIAIMKKLNILEKKIFDSIMSGSTEYYKPDNIGSISNYDDPLRINGILASTIYNKLKDDNMPAINLEERNKIIKIKLNVTKESVEGIKDEFPETYDKMKVLLQDPILGKRVNVMALPLGESVPKWIYPFIDYTSIINSNLKTFPVEAIGLNRLQNDSVNYSNMINL